MTLRTAGSVAIAGVIGAAARWAAATQLDGAWALLVANVVGCALVGWVTARHERVRHLLHRGGAGLGPAPSPWLAAGFCGALTSMSALALQLAAYLDSGRVGTAFAWLGLTIVACTLAFVAGRTLAIARGAKQ